MEYLTEARKQGLLDEIKQQQERAFIAQKILNDMKSLASAAGRAGQRFFTHVERPTPTDFNPKHGKLPNFNKIAAYLAECANAGNRAQNHYNSLLEREELQRKNEAEAIKEKENEAAKAMFQAKAIAYITVNSSMVVGVDYQICDAVEKADNIRFTQMVKEALEKFNPETDNFFDFDGKNCDDCSGWDGESHRCNCGNRRVCWVSYGHFDNMTIYGEAD